MNVFLVVDAYPSPDNVHDAVYLRDQARALARTERVGVALRRIYSPRQWWRLGHQVRQAWVRYDGGIGIYQQPRFVPTCRSQWCLRRSNRDSVAAALDRHTRDLGKPDVIHAHCAAFAGEAAADVGAKHGIPVVLTEHYSFACDLIEQMGRRLLDVYDRADLLLTVSASLASRLRDAGVTRTPAVLGNVVDTETFRRMPGSEPTGPPWRILSVTSDRPVKDVPTLIRAVHRVAQTISVECLIVGGGSFADVHKMVDALGLGDTVRFKPAASRRDLAGLMAEAHLVVSSSRTETFGMSIAEALCVGRPVVATRSGGPEEIIHNGDGLLVPAEDPDALAGAMVNVLQNHRDYDSEPIACRAHARFAPEVWLPRILSLYRSVTTDAN